jgi:hypothetical protein
MHLLAMDPNFGGLIFLIQMFFSTILTNFIMTYECTLWGILAIKKKFVFGCGGKNLDNPHIGFKWKQTYDIPPTK